MEVQLACHFLGTERASLYGGLFGYGLRLDISVVHVGSSAGPDCDWRRRTRELRSGCCRRGGCRCRRRSTTRRCRCWPSYCSRWRRSVGRAVLAALSTAFPTALSAASSRSRGSAGRGVRPRDPAHARTPTKKGEGRIWNRCAVACSARWRRARVRVGAASDGARPGGRALSVRPAGADDRSADAVVLQLEASCAGSAAVSVSAARARSLLSAVAATGSTRPRFAQCPKKWAEPDIAQTRDSCPQRRCRLGNGASCGDLCCHPVGASKLLAELWRADLR
jgi:hypothetical protein